MANKSIYTDNVVEKLVEAYTSADSDESRKQVMQNFAEELNVSPRSVQSKLVSLGVYVKPQKAAARSNRVRKVSLAAAIANKLDGDEAMIKDLTKVTKNTLLRIASAILDSE